MMATISIREGMIEVMKGLPLTEAWLQFERACKDQFRDTDWDWTSSPWGRLINGKRVFVVLSHEGESHAKWKLFVDNRLQKIISEINPIFGSGKDAMRRAEQEVG